MRTLCILAFCFLSTFTLRINASSIDSLEQVYADTENLLEDRLLAALELGRANKNKDVALAYFHQMFAWSETVNNAEKAALSQLQLGYVYHNRSVFDSAIIYYHRALELYVNVDVDNQSAMVLRNLGRIDSKQGRWPDAINHYQASLAIEESNGNIKGIAALFNLIGSIYRKQKQFNEALIYFEQSYEKAEEVDAIGTMVDALGNQATTYQEVDSTDLAIEYFQKTLTLSRENDLDRRTAICLLTLGQILQMNGDASAAKPLLEEANELYIELGNERGTGSIKATLGQVALIEGKGQIAVNYCEEAYKLVKTTRNSTALKTTLSCLVKSYEAIGDFEKANAYFKELDNLKTELYADSKVKEVTELQMEYEFQKEQQKTELAQAQKNARQSLIRNSLILGLLAIAVIAFLVYRSAVQRKKTNTLLEEKNVIISKALSEKELLLKEIHHRVKNNLQVISSLLSMQSRFIEDETAIEAIKGGRDRVKSMALIHQNLYQEDNLTGIEVKDYFEKLAQSLFNSYNIEPDRITLELDIEPINLDVDTVIPLGLVVNELVSNALKHAFPDDRKGVIRIQLVEEIDISTKKAVLVLEVLDNGIGMEGDTPGEFSDSFGYRMIHAFKDKLEANLDLHTRDGTQVRMRIFDYQKAG